MISFLQAEMKLYLQTDPSDIMNELIYNVRKVSQFNPHLSHCESLLLW